MIDAQKNWIYWTTMSVSQLEDYRKKGEIPPEYEWKGMELPYGRTYLEHRVKSDINGNSIDTNLGWGIDYLLLTIQAPHQKFSGSGFEDMEITNNDPVGLQGTVIEKVGQNVPLSSLEGLTLHDDVREYFGIAKSA